MAQQTNGGGGDDVLININVTGRDQIAGARAEGQALNEELNKTGKKDLTAPAKSLRTQLLEAKTAAQLLYEQGKKNTAEYRNAVKHVSELKDRIQEMNRTFDAFDPDNKFKVFSQAASSGAKIVQGYAGAMAFLGVESEDATKTIAKLQGIMAFTDAISSIADIKDSYQDFMHVLGLTSKATEEVAVAQTAAAETTNTAATAEITAEERVLAARAQVAETTIALQTAMDTSRAAGFRTIQEYWDAETALDAAFLARTAATNELTAAQTALNAATAAGAAASTEATVATEGLTVAEEGATAASFTLGTALKLIGIGLIISAITYLLTNFDKVKAKVIELMPALGKSGETWNKFKEILFGVGNVIIQFIIAPIKSVISLLQGDFKQAMADLASGIDVINNYEKGASDERKAQAEAARQERLKKEIEINERIIAERKALGKKTYDLEVENQRRRIEVLDKADKEYKKNRADAESALTIIVNTEIKRRADIYKAKLKADLDQIKANNLEAKRLVAEGTAGERAIALTDLDIKYKKEFALLEKRKKDVKDYNQEYKNLTTARAIEEERVNKKYGDAIKAYNDEIAQTYFSEYEKKEAEIKKKAEDLLKNATPTEKAKIKSNEAFQLSQNTAESVASSASKEANTALTKAEDIDRPKDTDTPSEARTKVNNLAKARLDAEQAAYELRKSQLEGHYEELQQLEADHEKAVTDITQENAESRKNIAKLEMENKLKMYDAVAQGAEAFSDILGQNTLVGKGLAVAASTIATYSAISGQLAAFSGVPIPGYAVAQAIATGIVGFNNVRKLLTVSVPNSKGGSSSTAGSSGASVAPVINSTVLARNNSGANDVVNAVNKQQEQPKNFRAYIVNKDLKDQQAKDAYFDAQSTY